MIPWLRAALAFSCFALVTLVLLPLQILAVRFDWPLQRAIVVTFHRILVRLLGLRVHVHGTLETARPLMLASNHVSWMDIHVLSSIAYVSFIAKAEVAGWPLFGTFARLQHTVFVEREAKRKSAAQASEIAARIAAGDALVLFPEGCTYRRVAIEGLRRKGRPWNLSFVSPSFECLRTAIDEGLGITVLARALVTPEMQIVDHAAGLPKLPAVDLVYVRAPEGRRREVDELSEFLIASLNEAMVPMASPSSAVSAIA